MLARRLFAPKTPEPSYPLLPEVSARGESSVPGVYLAGEVAGTPLIKLDLNDGHDLIDRLHPELAAESRPAGAYDLVIVGAGAAGLGAAARAKELGLAVIVLEASQIAETVRGMTKGKILYAEPVGVAKRSPLWFEECTREQLLEVWSRQIRELGLEVREHEKVVSVRRAGALLIVASDQGEYRAKRVVLAVGKAGNPRKAGVPGEREHAAKIAHRLVDASLHRGQHLLIYGGGDVALEAAVALADTNQVTLATIDSALTHPSKRNLDALRAKEAEGKVRVLLDTSLVEIASSTVTVARRGGAREVIANDLVFEMIGGELPTGLFRQIGIRLEGEWHWKRYLALVLVFLGVYSTYAIKSYGKGATAWPFEHLISPAAYDAGLSAIFSVAFRPFRWIFSEWALRDILSDRGYQQGFLYSGTYTILMLVFGFQALIRWRGIARNPQHQTWRYASLLAFQIGFFVLVNLIAVQALSTKYAWRAWGLYQPFPLFFNTFFWWYPGDPRWVVYAFVGAGLLGTLLAIPLLSRNHGKRFCTWVCGCGGLAETLGDRWRHLSPKGPRSRAWEFQGALILAASVLVLVIVIGLYRTDGNNPWWRLYSYLVDFWLVAVIPMALYPFFGGKIWCRYWCPLAAYNQLLARWYGRLKIVSNDKCISCTQCSRHCQVGVDVMAFAKQAAPFDNRNSACIQCGICIDVCPMGVLSFTTKEGGPPPRQV